MAHLLEVVILLVLATLVPIDAGICPSTPNHTSSCTCDATAATLREEMQQVRDNCICNETTNVITLREEMTQLIKNLTIRYEYETERLREEVHELRQEVENCTCSNKSNPAIAFYASVDSPNITEGSNVPFNPDGPNKGGGFNPLIPGFRCPLFGDGVYFFYVHLVIDDGEYGWFSLRKNNEVLCRMEGDNDDNGKIDNPTATCGTVVELVAGDIVSVYYDQGTDDTPLRLGYNGLAGFLLFQ